MLTKKIPPVLPKDVSDTMSNIQKNIKEFETSFMKDLDKLMVTNNMDHIRHMLLTMNERIYTLLLEINKQIEYTNVKSLYDKLCDIFNFSKVYADTLDELNTNILDLITYIRKSMGFQKLNERYVGNLDACNNIISQEELLNKLINESESVDIKHSTRQLIPLAKLTLHAINTNKINLMQYSLMKVVYINYYLIAGNQ